MNRNFKIILSILQQIPLAWPSEMYHAFCKWLQELNTMLREAKLELNSVLRSLMSYPLEATRFVRLAL